MADTPARLTVILTTSPTPSAPSTELIASVLDSYSLHCPSLLNCNVIVVLDGYDKVVPKAQLKKGRVTPEQARDFSLYKENVKKLLLDQHYGDGDVALSQTEAAAEFGGSFHQHDVPYTITRTQDKRITFIEPSWRLGFGLAVRSALRVTETPYVWVQQHDWALVSEFPLEPLLQIMEESEAKPAPVKYVCLPGVRMLSYATSTDVQAFPALRTLTSSLKGEYGPDSGPLSAAKVPLTPLFFWHDKPHVASTAHYLSRVFPSRLAMLRGDFIEDKIGQRARAQMKEGLWAKWATWLYYPDDGKQLCLKHLKGRTWGGEAREAKKIESYRQLRLKTAVGEGAEAPDCAFEDKPCHVKTTADLASPLRPCKQHARASSKIG